MILAIRRRFSSRVTGKDGQYGDRHCCNILGHCNILEIIRPIC